MKSKKTDARTQSLALCISRATLLLYLPLDSTLSLLRVSRQVRDLVRQRAQQVWAQVLRGGQKTNRHWFKHTFLPKATSAIASDSKDQIEYQLQFTKNLFRNSSGKLKFEYWKIIKNGGEGWSVAPVIATGSTIQRLTFSGSWGLCEIAQVADLASFQHVFRELGYRFDLRVGVLVSSRRGCSARANVSVIGHNSAYVYEEGVELGDEGEGTFKLVTFTISDPKVARQGRYVALTLATNTAEKRGPGARFAGAFLRIVPHSFLAAES